MLTRDEILGGTLKTIVINVPELGGEVRLQEMNGKLRGRLDLFYMNSEDKDHAYQLMKGFIAALSIVDDKGNLLFTEAEAELLATKLSAITLDRIDKAATKLNLLDDKEVEKQAKKSTASRGRETTGT